MTPAVELSLPVVPDLVPRARRFVRAALADVEVGLRRDAESVVTELVTNAVLHGRPPVTVRLAVSDGVRVEVHDTGHRLPLRLEEPGEATTGRGLTLVAALASAWGVDPSEEGGKAVWAVLVSQAAPHEPQPAAELGSRPQEVAAEGERLYLVDLGEVPTRVLVAAAAHADSLVREFTLALSDGEGPLQRCGRSLLEVAEEFAAIRMQLREQAMAAAAEHQVTTRLRLRVPATAADAGERYLATIEEAERQARAERLLTLEAPPVQQVFRRWYVSSAIEQLRAQAAGESRSPVPTFTERLAREFDAVAPLTETAVRLALVQQVTADLAAAATVSDVTRTVTRDAVEHLHADVAIVYLLGDDGVLRTAGRNGEGDEELARRYEQYRLDADLPGSIALRTGQALVFSNRAELAARFPQLAGAYPEEMTLLVAPLVVGGHRLGALALRFLGASTVDEDTQRAMLTTLAGVTAQALERAMAASAASEAAEKLAFLAEASVVLASSLDHRTVLQAVADLVVPRLADWCVIQLLRRGTLSTVALTHFDPAKAQWARRLQGRYPTDMSAPSGAPNVIRTGRSEIHPDLTPEMIERAALDREHLGLLTQLGMTSALVVPLTGRTGVVGAITMLYAESGRRYEPADVVLAEDLARRAALAVETAEEFREQSGRLADVLRVAEAAQRAILADLPPRVGAVSLAARYVSAAAEALVGGDLYEVVERPGAVRLLVGDVRGKGLDAIRVATVVLGEFRAAAADVDDLRDVARLMDRRVRRYLGEEDFVTALVVDINDDGGYMIVNLGHPCPLLATAGGVTEVACPASPPLGLGVTPELVTGRLLPGDRLLLFTDGIVEARTGDRQFVELATITAPLSRAPIDSVLDDILDELRARVGTELGDDLALLGAEYQPRPQAMVPRPADRAREVPPVLGACS